MRRSALLSSVLGPLLLASACSDATCGPAKRCHVEEASCQAQALEIAHCYTGVEASVEPKVRVRSIDQLVAEYEDQLAERSADETRDAHLWRTGLALMGLSELDEDPASTYGYNLRWVGARYDSAKDRITVIADAHVPSEGAVALLVHEYVHALQDARRGDEAPVPTSTTDAALAARAMTEGEAELYQTFTAAEGRGFSLSDLRDSAFESLRVAIGSDRPYDNAYQRFTYDWGGWWAVRAWRRGAAEAVAALVSEPPSTTWHVMAGEISKSSTPGRWEQQSRDDFGAVVKPVVDPRFRPVEWDAFGAWMLTYLDASVGDHWVNDSFHVLHDDTQEETVAIWHVTLDSAHDAKLAQDQVYQRIDRLQERALDDGGDPSFGHHSVQVDKDTLTWLVSTEPCDDDCVEVLDWVPQDEQSAKRFRVPVVPGAKLSPMTRR